MQQLMLWDETPAVPEGYRVVPEIGGTFETQKRWADGDTSPEQLARLARVWLHNVETKRATNGVLCWFEVIATRVEQDHVIATLRRIEPRLKSYCDHQGDDEEID